MLARMAYMMLSHRGHTVLAVASYFSQPWKNLCIFHGCEKKLRGEARVRGYTYMLYMTSMWSLTACDLVLRSVATYMLGYLTCYSTPLRLGSEFWGSKSSPGHLPEKGVTSSGMLRYKKCV